MSPTATTSTSGELNAIIAYMHACLTGSSVEDAFSQAGFKSMTLDDAENISVMIGEMVGGVIVALNAERRPA